MARRRGCGRRARPVVRSSSSWPPRASDTAGIVGRTDLLQPLLGTTTVACCRRLAWIAMVRRYRRSSRSASKPADARVAAPSRLARGEVAAIPKNNNTKPTATRVRTTPTVWLPSRHRRIKLSETFGHPRNVADKCAFNLDDPVAQLVVVHHSLRLRARRGSLRRRLRIHARDHLQRETRTRWHEGR